MFFTLSHNLSVRTSVECMCNVYEKINVSKDFGDRGKLWRPYRARLHSDLATRSHKHRLSMG